MGRDGGKWRFTSPTNAGNAFAQALRSELGEEGGVVRGQRMAEQPAASGACARWASALLHREPGAFAPGRAFTFREMYDVKGARVRHLRGSSRDGDTFRIRHHRRDLPGGHPQRDEHPPASSSWL